MNIFEGHPFKVILDYAHNPAAIQAMCNAIERMEVKGRRLCVLAGPGDRRDEDIQEMAQIAAGHFDHFVCKADDNRRRRAFDEIPKILQSTLKAAGIKDKDIEVIPDEFEAVEHSLRLARPDDLLVIFGDEIARCWKQITNFDPMAKEKAKTSTAKAQPGNNQSQKDDFVLDKSQRLIRDERGVRLAKEEAD